VPYVPLKCFCGSTNAFPSVPLEFAVCYQPTEPVFVQPTPCWAFAESSGMSSWFISTRNLNHLEALLAFLVILYGLALWWGTDWTKGMFSREKKSWKSDWSRVCAWDPKLEPATVSRLEEMDPCTTPVHGHLQPTHPSWPGREGKSILFVIKLIIIDKCI